MSQNELIRHISVDSDLFSKIIQWAKDRNLIHGATAQGQALKLGSEVSETIKALTEGDIAEVIDGIGDSVVVAIIVSEQIKRPLLNALWNTDAPIFQLMSDVRSPALAVAATIGYVQDFVLKDQPDQASFKMVQLVAGLNRLAESNGVTLAHCVRKAYEVIKDRKGIVYNGSFIKESDPKYPEAVAAVEAEDHERHFAG